MDTTLPEEFEALVPLVAEWVLPDSAARLDKRLASDLENLQSFYDAMLPHAPAALAYLAERQLGALDDAEENLLRLMLSLAEVGPAIEWYQNPAVVDGFPAHRFSLIEQIPDTAAQEA